VGLTRAKINLPSETTDIYWRVDNGKDFHFSSKCFDVNSLSWGEHFPLTIDNDQREICFQIIASSGNSADENQFDSFDIGASSLCHNLAKNPIYNGRE